MSHRQYHWSNRVRFRLVVGLVSACCLSGCSFGFGPPASSASGVPLLPGALPPGSPAGEFAVHVVHGKGHAVELIVGVSIDGHGPYPFVLDTGAANSVVSSGLASLLHLSAGAPSTHATRGAGCSTGQPTSTQPTRRVELGNWEVGATSLPLTTVATLPGFGSGTAKVDGLLGSDALSARSALSIDYGTGLATLAPTPLAFGSQVPLDVVRIEGEVVPIARVSIGAHSYRFVVDTGASTSALTPSLSTQLHLPVVARGTTVSGATCSSKVDVVGLSHWRVGTVPLPAEDVAALNLPYVGAPDPVGLVRGLVGEDVLSSFGTVTLDYADQRLMLGS